MANELMNRAAAAGAIAFVASLCVHFLTTPAPSSSRGLGMERGPLTLERVVEHVVDAVERREASHRVWQTASEGLRGLDSPVTESLEAFGAALPAETQRHGAAEGFVGYYVGFDLAIDGRRSEAREAFEIALDAFREWDADRHAEQRAWLQGFDVLYEARTLMRLARNEASASTLDRLAPRLEAEPIDVSLTMGAARTYAEIDRPDRAAALFDRGFGTLDDKDTGSWLIGYCRQARRWERGTGEPMAAEASVAALHRAAEARMERWLREGTRAPRFLHDGVRRLGEELERIGRDDEARETWTLGARLAAREARHGPTAAAHWLLTARYRALLGDAGGTAEALRHAYEAQSRDPITVSDADALASEHGLSRVIHDERVREAVRLFGTPRAWREPEEQDR